MADRLCNLQLEFTIQGSKVLKVLDNMGYLEFSVGLVLGAL